MLKEIVYRLIRDHNAAESCLTRHLLTDLNMHLDWDLGLSVSVDENTFRSVLNELKDEGRIDHIVPNTDTWVHKPQPPRSC